MNAPFFKTGIHAGIPNEQYHADKGSISKSGLWTIYKQSPLHYRFPPPPAEETTQSRTAKDLGTAIHTAILEPDKFTVTVFRGPEDRKGNNWKDAQAEATNTGRICLTASDYDKALTIRDVIHADAFLNALIVSPHSEVEHSAFWRDEETGAHCRSRPDLYRRDLGIMLDVKSAADAHPDNFPRVVSNFGYHTQEAFYSDGHRANGAEVNGFVFLAIEKKEPFAYGLYELPPSIVEEGRAIYRKALATYQNCVETETWPGYVAPGTVRELSFKRWSYSETQAPDGGEE